jgi:hypothetical protein
VVVFATGYQRDPRIQAATVVGEEIAKSMRTSRGLDKDGEIDWNMMPVGKCLHLRFFDSKCIDEAQERHCGS